MSLLPPIDDHLRREARKYLTYCILWTIIFSVSAVGGYVVSTGLPVGGGYVFFWMMCLGFSGYAAWYNFMEWSWYRRELDRED